MRYFVRMLCLICTAAALFAPINVYGSNNSYAPLASSPLSGSSMAANDSGNLDEFGLKNAAFLLAMCDEVLCKIIKDGMSDDQKVRAVYDIHTDKASIRSNGNNKSVGAER